MVGPGGMPTFLCGFCPAELFTNTKSDIGPCDKLHDERLKNMYQESERCGKLGYEDEFLHYLEKLVRDLDRRIERGRERLQKSVSAKQKVLQGETGINSDKLKTLNDEINMKVAELDTLGTRGLVEEAQQLMKRVEDLERERERERMHLVNMTHKVKQDNYSICILPMYVRVRSSFLVCNQFFVNDGVLPLQRLEGQGGQDKEEAWEFEDRDDRSRDRDSKEAVDKGSGEKEVKMSKEEEKEIVTKGKTWRVSRDSRSSRSRSRERDHGRQLPRSREQRLRSPDKERIGRSRSREREKATNKRRPRERAKIVKERKGQKKRDQERKDQEKRDRGRRNQEKRDRGGETKRREWILSATCAGIYTSSEEQLRQHLEGRRHLALLQRVETARRSIYVAWIPICRNEILGPQSLFERFGSVVQVALDDKKFFAIVEFTSVDGALQPREAKLTSTKAPLEVQGSTCSSESMETVAAEQPSAPFSSRVELPPDLLSQLQQASTTTAQMELVAANYQMSEEGMKAQCEVCAHLRRMFPRSLVILFGSVVSGHAFVTSDCDVCILTDPSPRDMEDFDPTRYYNQQLLRIWHSTLYSGPGLQEAGGTCLPAAPQQWVTHFQQGAKSSSPLFDVILSCLQSDTRFTRVVPIPFARCPIAWALQHATDQSLLVTGIKRAQLHNYALTLMLIQALQCADPPVLPCLQDPGAWPVNMAWFAQGFAPTTNRPTAVGGWHCSFTPPGSLMHSKNTQSPAILLAHFFHFYSEVFDLHTHCVTIHINPSRRLTIEEAMRLAQESNPACRVSHFREGQLCIQDPFELSHNVAKSLSRDALVRLSIQLPPDYPIFALVGGGLEVEVWHIGVAQ
eukprot:Em0015g1145a